MSFAGEGMSTTSVIVEQCNAVDTHFQTGSPQHAHRTFLNCFTSNDFSDDYFHGTGPETTVAQIATHGYTGSYRIGPGVRCRLYDIWGTPQIYDSTISNSPTVYSCCERLDLASTYTEPALIFFPPEVLFGSFNPIQTTSVGSKYYYPNKYEITYGLENIFQFEDRITIGNFMQAYPFVVDVLLEAYPKLVMLFGENSVIRLRLLEDSDGPFEPELFGVIRTSLEPPEALRRLEIFDSEWWLGQSDRAKYKLNFNVEYL
jgi:hypothetical protein